MNRDTELPTGLGLVGVPHTGFLGMLGAESALSAALSRHFHCLLSVSPLSVSQQAESEMPWGWGPPAKDLTH